MYIVYVYYSFYEKMDGSHHAYHSFVYINTSETNVLYVTMIVL